MHAWCRAVLVVLLVGIGTIGLTREAVRADVVQPGEAESGSLIVTAETAEVREGPSPDYDVITVVQKGEIFVKLGRTGAWYYIKINEGSFGWISGRAVGRFQAEGSQPPNVGLDENRYIPYYPGYYGYPYYWWGQPYFSWEWYFYDSEPHRYRSWEHDRDDRRDWDNDRSRHDAWHTDEGRSRDGVRHGTDDYRGSDSHRDSNTGHRSTPQQRPFAPRIRPPFLRR